MPKSAVADRVPARVAETGCRWGSESAAQTENVTRPQVKIMLSEVSSWVSTRDQTMLVAKQSTQTRQAR